MWPPMMNLPPAITNEAMAACSDELSGAALLFAREV
jgi:hypothetical protein